MRELVWVGSSKKDLSAMPRPVKQGFGFALRMAQQGERHEQCKTLKGFGGAGVIEVVEDFESDTYRAVYTVKFEEAVYVLHSFKKRSHRGGQLPKPDRELISSRLRQAQEEHDKWIRDRKGE